MEPSSFLPRTITFYGWSKPWTALAVTAEGSLQGREIRKRGVMEWVTPLRMWPEDTWELGDRFMAIYQWDSVKKEERFTFLCNLVKTNRWRAWLYHILTNIARTSFMFGLDWGRSTVYYTSTFSSSIILSSIPWWLVSLWLSRFLSLLISLILPYTLLSIINSSSTCRLFHCHYTVAVDISSCGGLPSLSRAAYPNKIYKSHPEGHCCQSS